MTKTICDVKGCEEEVITIFNDIKFRILKREKRKDELSVRSSLDLCLKHQQQLDKLLNEFLNNN